MSAVRKKPLDVAVAYRRIRRAVARFPKAAMFQLADEGYTSVFELLVSCIISIRTRDETTLPTSRRLFQVARTPAAVCGLSESEIDALIRGSTFHESKARSIRTIARRAVDEFAGELPADAEVLMDLPGIGPKCANLVLGIAVGRPCISVDIHVHRVVNRWGLVEAKTPVRTMAALETVLPQSRWVETNELLMPFGKHICTGALPRCSTCPVRDMCRQVGVTTRR
jgi:endonuclease-3